MWYNISANPNQIAVVSCQINNIMLRYQMPFAGKLFGSDWRLNPTTDAAKGFLLPNNGDAKQMKKQKYNHGSSGLPVSVRKQRNEMFQQGFIWCSWCEQFKAIKEFNPEKRDRSNYGYRYHCISCDKKYKQKYKERHKKLAKKRNSTLSKQWAALAGGKCQRCGYDEYYSALAFHHVYPGEKEHNPATVIINSTTKTGYNRCWKELDKCCLLCSNCHNGYESGEWRAEFIKRDGLGWTIGKELPLDDDRYKDKAPVYEQAELIFDYSICKDFSEQLSFSMDL